MDFRDQPDAPPNCMFPDDWLSQMEPDSRRRIVNKIICTLKKNFAFSGQELHELKQAAARMEETSYGAATSQSAYLRDISLKMLALEAKNYEAIPQLPINGPTSASEYLFESESNSWRPALQEPLPDWQSLLQPDSRYRIVNKIFETLKTVLPFTDEERGLSEIRRIAEKFEEKIYNPASSQTNYLRKISLKMRPWKPSAKTDPDISNSFRSYYFPVHMDACVFRL